MCDARTRQLWELYPGPVGKVAQQEPIFGMVTQKAFVPTAQTNLLYMPGMTKAQNPESFPEVSDEQVELARRMIESSIDIQISDLDERAAALRFVEQVWPFSKAKMLENKGFASWLIDGGVQFDFSMLLFYAEVNGFIKFPPEVKQALGLTTTWQMDAAFGEYHDVLGRRKRFPAGGVIWWHILNHALWRGVRWRGPWFNYFLRQVGKGEYVADLCSGALNAEKRFGYPQRDGGPQIVAYDTDPNASSVAQLFFERPISSYGITFRNDDFRAIGDDPTQYGKHSLVFMQGGMSYYVPETAQTLGLMRKLLKKGGRAAFEVEVFTPDLLQTVLVLGLRDQHETMTPDESVESATARITEAVKAVGGFKVEKVLSDTDFYGPGVVPTTVLFVLEAI